MLTFVIQNIKKCKDKATFRTHFCASNCSSRYSWKTPCCSLCLNSRQNQIQIKLHWLVQFSCRHSSAFTGPRKWLLTFPHCSSKHSLTFPPTLLVGRLDTVDFPLGPTQKQLAGSLYGVSISDTTIEPNYCATLAEFYAAILCTRTRVGSPALIKHCICDCCTNFLHYRSLARRGGALSRRRGWPSLNQSRRRHGFTFNLWT